jgi:sulfite reductase alpha subunit-like flavoprotein
MSNATSQMNGSKLQLEGNFDVVVQKNERITSMDHFQDVRHVELKIKNNSKEALYEPGDVAVILPKNLPKEVDAFLEYMKWSDLADEQVIIRPASEGKFTPLPSSKRTALTNACVTRSPCSIALATYDDL